MTFHRMFCLFFAGCLMGLHSASAAGAEARERFGELLKAPLKLSSGDGSVAKRFRCSMTMQLPDLAVIMIAERFDADFTLVTAYPDGTPVLIAQNNEIAAFETMPMPRWQFFRGAKSGMKLEATLESFSWKSLLFNGNDETVPQFEIDMGSILQWVQHAGAGFCWGKDESEIIIKTDTASVRLELSKSADSALPLTSLFAKGKDFLVLLNFDTTLEKRCLNTMTLSEAATRLNAEVQPLSKDFAERSPAMMSSRLSGETRRQAWQILEVMHIPVAHANETPLQRIVGAAGNDLLTTGRESCSRFCIDRLVVENGTSIVAENEDEQKIGLRKPVGTKFVSRHRFRIERDGQKAAVVVLTDGGDPVALCSQDWVLVLDSNRGWLLHSGVETLATNDLLRRHGPGALGLNWSRKDRPAAVKIDYEMSLVTSLLEADWQPGKTPSSLRACHPKIQICCELSLNHPATEFAYGSVRFQTPYLDDLLTIVIGDEAKPVWTALTREAIIAALHPIEEPLDENRQSQMQLLQQGLTSVQRAKSRELRGLVEEVGDEPATPTPTAPANFKRLP